MPELPEVEALARFVSARAAGRRIARIDVYSFAAVKTATPRPSELVGRTIAGATRRGKWLVVRTLPGIATPSGAGDGTVTATPSSGTGDGTRAATTQGSSGGASGAAGDADNAMPVGQESSEGTALILAVHFSRGGWLAWRDAPAGPRAGAMRAGARRTVETIGASALADPALRAVPRTAARPLRPGPLACRVELEDGAGFDLTEAGTQKRLAIHVVHAPEDVERIRTLGPDPLDPSFDAAALARILAGRTGRIKYVLSDQELLAGVGNAYSDEALHAARLSPFKPAANLTPDEVERLHGALVGLLREAVDRAAGLPASGLKADKKSSMRVHGRTGLPCPICGDTVREVSFADRSLQYCPTCQTNGRPLADRRLSRLLK